MSLKRQVSTSAVNPVLRYFTEDKENGVFLCTVQVGAGEGDEGRPCGEKITASQNLAVQGSRTYNLKRHIKRFHPDIDQARFLLCC